MKKLLKLLILFIVFIGFPMSLYAHSKVKMETKRRIPSKGTIVEPPILRGPILDPVIVSIDSNTLSIEFLESEGIADVCVISASTGNIVFWENVPMSDVLTVTLCLSDEKGEYWLSISTEIFLTKGDCYVD